MILFGLWYGNSKEKISNEFHRNCFRFQRPRWFLINLSISLEFLSCISLEGITHVSLKTFQLSSRGKNNRSLVRWAVNLLEIKLIVSTLSRQSTTLIKWCKIFFIGTHPSIMGNQVGAPTKHSLLLLYSLCVVCSMLDENIPKRAQRCPYF